MRREIGLTVINLRSIMSSGISGSVYAAKVQQGCISLLCSTGMKKDDV